MTAPTDHRTARRLGPVAEATRATAAAAASLDAAVETVELAIVTAAPPRTAGRAYTVLNAVVALLLILLLAPVMLAVAIAVKLDGGPVLFRQSRVGKHGTEFGMLKFRSMVVDAEARLTALAARDEGAGPLFKVYDDPRVTRVGVVLRRYSLDELPQLFNVVTGAMHLVGPRPALRREVAAYCPLAARRLAVKPGLTGLWQVSGRSDLPWNESIRLDAEYVERWSPMLDLSILARTAGAVARGGGAY